MKKKILSVGDIDVIVESLGHTLYRYENYDKHPSYEFKQQQVKKVNDTLEKVRLLKKELMKDKDNG